MAPILEVSGLVKRFGGVTALGGVSLALEPARVYGLIGPNGSGKTTLFDCITGLARRDTGEIRFRGERIDSLGPPRIARRGIGRTFQAVRVFPELTVIENLLAVATGRYRPARARAAGLLRRFGLAPLSDARAGTLAHGQQKLVEILRALMTDPELLLLDEPAAGVGDRMLTDVLEGVRALRDRGKTVLLVEHDMGVVLGLCDTVLVLDHGEVVAEGPPGVIRSDPRVVGAYLGG